MDNNNNEIDHYLDRVLKSDPNDDVEEWGKMLVGVVLLSLLVVAVIAALAH